VRSVGVRKGALGRRLVDGYGMGEGELRVGVVVYAPVCDNRYEDGEEALENKNPCPCGLSAYAALVQRVSDDRVLVGCILPSRQSPWREYHQKRQPASQQRRTVPCDTHIHCAHTIAKCNNSRLGRVRLQRRPRIPASPSDQSSQIRNLGRSLRQTRRT
jgi:hypothetical protein